MSTEIAVQQPITPMNLLQLALQKESNVDVIAKLKAMQDEERDYQARVMFTEAFFDFKQNAPKIVKSASIVVKGETRGKYAPLDDICNKLIPALLQVGITHRWKTITKDDGKTTVTCFLRHRTGYEEEGSSMTAAPDQTGSKNAIQADGSTVSYLERYTLITSCGIAVQSQDRDGNPPPPASTEFVPFEDGVLEDWIGALEGASDTDELIRIFQDAYKAIQPSGDLVALKRVIDVKKARKEALSAASNRR